jgi:uncharacterized membrane protein YccC
MNPINRRAMVFSLNTYLAAMLALFLAFSLDLPRPFWAMITAYITSQNFAGAVYSKAFFRVLGTLVGSSVALILVPALVNEPVLLALALASWVALCLGVSLLDRTPRAYGFMLAGYTAALVGFPSVLVPEQIFQTAVARAEEISIGAMCAALVHGLIFPAALLPKLRADLSRMLRDAEIWAADVLARREIGVPGLAPRLTIDRKRFAADSTELFIHSTHLPYDASASLESRSVLVAIQDRLVTLLPLIAVVEDRLMVLDRLDAVSSALPPLVEELRRDLLAWVQNRAGTRAEAAHLIQHIRARSNEIEGHGWHELLLTNLYQRLIETIEVFVACRDLLLQLQRPARHMPADLRGLLLVSNRRQLHADPLPALRSALAGFLTVAVAAGFWIVTGWPDGATATMLAAVFVCLFATQDDPRPALRMMLLFTLLSVPVTAFYSFAVIPSVDGFPMLALALAPCLLVMGYFMARPATNQRAMGFMTGFMGGVAVQSAYNVDFASFMNANIAQLIGGFIALVVIAVCRVIGVAGAARRLVRLSSRDLAGLTRAKPELGQAGWVSRMIDREGLLQQRLARIGPQPELAGADLLTDLRTGINVLHLAQLRRGLPTDTAVNELLSRLHDFFLARARKLSTLPDPALLASLDRSLTEFAIDPNRVDHREGVAALVGLRRNLFPGADPLEAGLLA